MSILAIDIGSKTGWAIKRNDGLVISGNLDMNPKNKVKTIKGKKEKLYEHPGIRYKKFNDLLIELSSNYGEINEIAYEDVKRHTGVMAAHLYGGFKAILQMFSYKINAELFPYGVGVCKLEAVGIGRSDKEASKLFAKKWTGREIESEDEADALTVLYTHLKRTNRL